MNRIDKLFTDKKENILSVYFTAGFPNLNDTTLILKYLQDSGADLVEIGIPFSDPLADGPVIQHSSEKALENGMTLKLLFEQLKEIRKEIKIPILLMGYLNPVLQFGVEKFIKQCSVIGIDGLIIPDLPHKEYQEHYAALFNENGIRNIFLITPQTSEARIKLIDKTSNGFIYIVSAASTTGAKSDISQNQNVYFERIKSYNLHNPTLIGFGISNHSSFSKACEHSNGAIIGSAFINILKQSKDLQKDIHSFIKNIKSTSN